MASGNRIRYIKYDHRPGCKITLRAFTSSSTGARYRIILNEEEMEYYIRNERTKVFTKKSRKHKNMNVMKREAREDLESLGVKFKRESRDRSFGVAPKGYDQRAHEKKLRAEKAAKESDEI